MPFFIIFNLAFAALSFVDSPYLPLLVNDTLVAVAALCSLIFLLIACFNKLSSAAWQDGVACSALLVWYGYWPPEFSPDAPMFTGVPLYFAALSAWLMWAVIHRAARFDQETRQTLLHLQQLMRFDAKFIAGLMLISLAFPEHYLSYPLLTTLFIVRGSLQCCFEVVQTLEAN